jgi:hypothetical protein
MIGEKGWRKNCGKAGEKASQKKAESSHKEQKKSN